MRATALACMLVLLQPAAWSQLDTIHISGTSIDTTKVYDGTTAANIITLGEFPLLPYNLVTIDAEAHYLDASVGEDKPVVVTFTLSGDDAYRYVTPDSIVLYADITPLPIATDGLQLQLSREYNGTTDCEVITPDSLIGVLPGDTVGLIVTATFASPNVSFINPITVTHTLIGPQAGNYILALPFNYIGTITRRSLNIGGYPTVRLIKEYDGTDTAHVISRPELQNTVEADDIDFSLTAYYDSPEVGDNKTIYFHYQLVGDDIDNYQLLLSDEDTISLEKGRIVLPLVIDTLEGDQQFVATAYGFCSNERATLRYHVQQGEPIHYRILFSDEALAAGFDTNWFNCNPDDSLISFTIPNNCPAGHYEATIEFLNVSLDPTYYPCSFNINFNNAYLVMPFDDVISIDNSGSIDGQPDRFRTFQWYHNDQVIPNYDKPYYQELGGLTGKYAVMVNMGAEDEAMVCPTYFNTADKTSLQLMPSPVVSTTTVKLQGFEETQHQLQVFNSQGVVVITTTFEGTQYQLDLSSLPQGTYLVTVDGRSTKTLKL